VGMAQGAYIHGVSVLWFQVGICIWIAMCATYLLLGKILEGRKTYSILDVIGSLYDKKTTKLAGILQLIFCLILLPLPITASSTGCSRQVVWYM
jgi:Na+/proline symporter